MSETSPEQSPELPRDRATVLNEYRRVVKQTCMDPNTSGYEANDETLVKREIALEAEARRIGVTDEELENAEFDASVDATLDQSMGMSW